MIYLGNGNYEFTNGLIINKDDFKNILEEIMYEEKQNDLYQIFYDVDNFPIVKDLENLFKEKLEDIKENVIADIENWDYDDISELIYQVEKDFEIC